MYNSTDKWELVEMAVQEDIDVDQHNRVKELEKKELENIKKKYWKHADYMWEQGYNLYNLWVEDKNIL